ncbi:hypothetical protein EK21DRAFT_86876 [Setomelanomma holmii]|uniref:Uncharacterized protein n=1 Tax=Setomelanomma holmii TaxID=210430 RepID=A0A9P4HFY8_9PLEO|nr:hypothetical protein EK21DRAFT_86876 [Setomelanomma holmii]
MRFTTSILAAAFCIGGALALPAESDVLQPCEYCKIPSFDTIHLLKQSMSLQTESTLLTNSTSEPLVTATRVILGATVHVLIACQPVAKLVASLSASTSVAKE